MGDGKPGATYQDVLDAPEHKVAEILDGQLFLSPRPALRHAQSASSLGAILLPAFGRGRGGPGGWQILYEPEIHLGDDILVPDIAGWRRTRLPVVPDAAFLGLAPDWLCEVLSPSTERIDRARKLRIYARERVAWIWLVNPVLEVLEVLALGPGGYVIRATYEGGGEVRPEPFDALAWPLDDLWLRSGSSGASEVHEGAAAWK
jgi:Uma2 family endonuclease